MAEHVGDYKDQELTEILQRASMPCTDIFSAFNSQNQTSAELDPMLCSLCKKTAVLPSVPSTEHSKPLAIHIAGHLESIALLSLPYDDKIESEVASEQSEAAAVSHYRRGSLECLALVKPTKIFEELDYLLLIAEGFADDDVPDMKTTTCPHCQGTHPYPLSKLIPGHKCSGCEDKGKIDCELEWGLVMTDIASTKVYSRDNNELDPKLSPFRKASVRNRLRDLVQVVMYRTRVAKMSALIQSWLNYCAKNHPMCKSQEKGYIPPRLIYVGSEAVSPRLEESRGEHPIQYVCLSYVWGRGDFLKLKTAVVGEFRAGLDMTALPQLFRDTILLVREIGIEHLWIDSLCIIQDDSEDCKQSGFQLADIFRGATITVAAVNASSPNTGLFDQTSSKFHHTTFAMRILGKRSGERGVGFFRRNS